MTRANIYRTHHCGELRENDIGKQVRVAGWVENIRDHGGVKFLDLRDHYGVVQVVVYDDALLAEVNRECTVSVSGEVVKRSEDTYNAKIATGTVEVRADSLTVLGKCAGNLPFEVASSTETKEEVRLKYRFLDLRNPLEIIDISDLFTETDFKPFCGKTVRAINVPGCASQPKSFFENMLKFATEIGMKGLGYVKVTEELTFQGPIDKFLSDADREELKRRAALKPGDVLYFIADTAQLAPRLAGQIRTEVARRLKLIDEDRFELCFVKDFPMYELDEETGRPAFTHNPFSMPQGGLEALETKDPLDVLAYQYDIVCNGVELSSGAVRNHDLDIMVKAFAIAGYTEDDLKAKFSALYNAFKYGAPPHAGMAPGIDRMVMLLTGEESIREVIAFPMNANAQDLLLGAPGPVSEQQLREVHIKLR